jgi:broad specificity phosphatase PhoE
VVLDPPALEDEKVAGRAVAGHGGFLTTLSAHSLNHQHFKLRLHCMFFMDMQDGLFLLFPRSSKFLKNNEKITIEDHRVLNDHSCP